MLTLAEKRYTYSLVIGIDENNLEVLVDTVLVYPVRVQDTEVSAPTSDALLSYASKAALELQVVDTLADGLAVGCTLRDRLLAVTTANTNAVDDIALLGFVAEAARLVGTRWAGCTVDHIQLAVFPAAHTQEEAENIRLLLLVELPNVLVRAHLAGYQGKKSAPYFWHPKLVCSIQPLPPFRSSTDLPNSIHVSFERSINNN